MDMGKTALGILVLTLLVTYQINFPIPQGVGNPVCMRLLNMVFEFGNIVSIVGYGLGLAGRHVILRNIFYVLTIKDNYKQLEVSDVKFDGVPVRIYRPQNSSDALMPGFVYYHGGGFVFGDLDTYDIIVADLARNIPAVVVSVDPPQLSSPLCSTRASDRVSTGGMEPKGYRLAPEHPFPAGLNDNLSATKYFLEHARDFGVDQNRIAIGGDSAGGNHAAVISSRLRDSKNSIQPKVQVLVYPWLQMIDFQTPSHLNTENHMIANPHRIAQLLCCYMGHCEDPLRMNNILMNAHTAPSTIKRYKEIMNFSVLPDAFLKNFPAPIHRADVATDERSQRFREMVLNPDVSPLLADSFENLPRTFLYTVQFDSVRDDGALYAHHLKRSGVDVTWYHADDTFHGHMGFVQASDISRRDADHVINYLQNHL